MNKEVMEPDGGPGFWCVAGRLYVDEIVNPVDVALRMNLHRL